MPCQNLIVASLCTSNQIKCEKTTSNVVLKVDSIRPISIHSTPATLHSTILLYKLLHRDSIRAKTPQPLPQQSLIKQSQIPDGQPLALKSSQIFIPISKVEFGPLA